MQRRLMLVLLAMPGSLVRRGANAQTPRRFRLRGEITAIDATTVTVLERSGTTLRIALTPNLFVGSVRNLALADIKPGSFIGTATRTTPTGELVALEVLVFPESARGTGEGHYEWDLAPGSMMTNANVDTVAEQAAGRVLKLSYKGGTKEVRVPEGTPVVTPAPASRDDLVVGRKVFAFVQGEPPDLSVGRIYVEKNGVVPPM